MTGKDSFTWESNISNEHLRTFLMGLQKYYRVIMLSNTPIYMRTLFECSFHQYQQLLSISSCQSTRANGSNPLRFQAADFVSNRSSFTPHPTRTADRLALRLWHRPRTSRLPWEVCIEWSSRYNRCTNQLIIHPNHPAGNLSRMNFSGQSSCITKNSSL